MSEKDHEHIAGVDIQTLENETSLEPIEILAVTERQAADLVMLRTLIDGKKKNLEKEARKFAEGLNGLAYIAEKGGKPVGYVEINLVEKLEEVDIDLSQFCHLSRVGVLDEYRKQGIGKKLLALADYYAKQNKRLGIWLDFLSDRSDLQEFYEGRGYRMVTEFSDHRDDRKRKLAIKIFE